MVHFIIGVRRMWAQSRATPRISFAAGRNKVATTLYASLMGTGTATSVGLRDLVDFCSSFPCCLNYFLLREQIVGNPNFPLAHELLMIFLEITE